MTVRTNRSNNLTMTVGMKGVAERPPLRVRGPVYRTSHLGSNQTGRASPTPIDAAKFPHGAEDWFRHANRWAHRPGVD